MMKIQVGPVSQLFLDIFRNKIVPIAETLRQASGGSRRRTRLAREDFAFHKGIPS